METEYVFSPQELLPVLILIIIIITYLITEVT